MYKPLENEDEYESPSELCITPIRRYADLSDEAPADVSNDCRRMAKSEDVQELSPGWRLGGTLGIGSKKARSSEGAKESFERRAIKAARYSRMTINCDVAGFLPLLQSGPRLTLNTQGSAKPPPGVCVGLRKNFLVEGLFC